MDTARRGLASLSVTPPEWAYLLMNGRIDRRFRFTDTGNFAPDSAARPAKKKNNSPQPVVAPA